MKAMKSLATIVIAVALPLLAAEPATAATTQTHAAPEVSRIGEIVRDLDDAKEGVHEVVSLLTGSGNGWERG